MTDIITSKITRREFVKGCSAVAGLGMIAPRSLSGATDPATGKKLNIACIGVGGRGAHDLQQMAHESDKINIVGVCDLDEARSKAQLNRFCPDFVNVPFFKDYRKMLDQIGKDIDAVIVATPDHSHAVQTMACMKLGKHVYTQKPLTHNIHEVRLLQATARELKIVSSMGIQNHALEGLRRGVDFIRSGVLGTIREVHVWTNRPAWPQGIPRPKETPAVPEGFDWDQWIGPARFRPYHAGLHPFAWRGYWDFGTGALGDMGCHNLDQPFWALDLRDPVSVEAVTASQAWWQKNVDLSETAPVASIVRYEFQQRGVRAPLTLTWYDGGLRPFRPRDLDANRSLGGEGVIYVGDNGVALAPSCGAPRLLPETKMKDFTYPERVLPQSSGHFKEWIDACLGEGPMPHANFDYASGLTELVLLGCLALRAGPGKKYLWDAKNMMITNCSAADALINEPYRNGWQLS